MLCLRVTDVKSFMSKLLIHNVFDNFLLAELDITSFYSFHMDGKTNRDWYDTDQQEELGEYSKWVSLKPYVYELVKGKKVPTSMKIVFYLSPENREKIVSRVGNGTNGNDVSQFCLNMKFEAGEMLLTTGVAFSVFTMDRTMQEQWDHDLRKFLKYYEIEFEVL